MATELVDASKLDDCCTAEANAIRAKTGSSSQIAYDWANNKGFADAIAAIPTGGTDYLPDICANTLTVLDDPGITRINRDFVFRLCTALTMVNLPNLTTIGSIQTGFYGCSNLEEIHLPNVGDAYPTNNSSGTFQFCTKLTLADIGGWKRLGGNEFGGCTLLKTLILRRTSDITELAAINAFANTPFASGGSGGTIYCPSALINTYRTASQWSTLDGYGTVTWTAIEGSPYELP